MDGIFNGRIESTHLGYEGHGIFTAYIQIRLNGGTQSFGGWTLQSKTCFGSEFLVATIDAVGVEKWEDLRGKNLRVDVRGGTIKRIGNILEEKWFDPKELSDRLGEP